MSLFSSFASYGYIHHRALNSFSDLNAARAIVHAHPGRIHIYEGDVCWDFTDGRHELYFRHPALVFDTLSPAKIQAGKDGKSLVTIADLLALKADDAFLVIELKVGRGDTRTALQYLLGFLNEHFRGRFWIDSFSLTLLKMVKEIAPETTVTLHTECVTGEHLVAAAPQAPLIKIVPLTDLDFVDGVAVRWRVGPAFMTKAAHSVRAAGKALLVSRIHDLAQFRYSLEWGASAGYAHYDFATLLAEEARFKHASAGAPASL